MQKLRAEKGITLIALVITIIVMLILVGVSLTVALNGGLFSTAQKATGDTKAERDNELALSDGKVTINGEEYNSIDEYVKGESSNEPTEPENPTTPSEPVKVTITPKKETYTIGEEVTIGAESFYVIADDTEKVTLLAKDCIDTENLVQSADADLPEFSSTNYWSSETEYPLDLNNYTIPADATSIITTAKTYGAKVGGTGRLMTHSEAAALETANSDILSDILGGFNGKSSSEYLNYWLGSASHADQLCAVDGGEYCWGIYFGMYNFYGVRPVVEISKANIS